MADNQSSPRQWPGWKTRMFTLEKSPKDAWTWQQWLIAVFIAVGTYIGLHGIPGH